MLLVQKRATSLEVSVSDLSDLLQPRMLRVVALLPSLALTTPSRVLSVVAAGVFGQSKQCI